MGFLGKLHDFHCNWQGQIARTTDNHPNISNFGFQKKAECGLFPAVLKTNVRQQCDARSRVEPTQMKMYEKFASKTKKRCEARPRMDDFPEKTIKKNVEDRPKNNDFFEK